MKYWKESPTRYFMDAMNLDNPEVKLQPIDRGPQLWYSKFLLIGKEGVYRTLLSNGKDNLMYNIKTGDCVGISSRTLLEGTTEMQCVYHSPYDYLTH